MVRKISGKTSPQPIHLFSKNNSLQTSSVGETANIMGETFQRNSSSISHSDKFKKFKIHAEKKPLHFSSDNSETYNFPFSMQELISSLDRAHDTSPGPDKGSFNYYVTVFLANFDPLPCHKVSHWLEAPPLHNVTLVCRPGLKPAVMLKKEFSISSEILI